MNAMTAMDDTAQQIMEALRSVWERALAECNGNAHEAAGLMTDAYQDALRALIREQAE